MKGRFFHPPIIEGHRLTPVCAVCGDTPSIAREIGLGGDVLKWYCRPCFSKEFKPN